MIVPGLSGFVTQYCPAHFDEVAGSFVAPSYQVGFNPLLQTDDNESFQTINTANPPKRQLFASSLFGGFFYSSAFQKLSSYRPQFGLRSSPFYSGYSTQRFFRSSFRSKIHCFTQVCFRKV